MKKQISYLGIVARYMACALIGTALFARSPAQADSGKLNLHAEGGFGFPIAGGLRPSEISDPPIGFVGQLAVDWQVFAPLAIEITGGAGQFFESFPEKQDQRDNSFYINGALGLRLRMFDEQTGYADETDGDLSGSLWFSTHAGYHYFDGSQFGIDFGLGYEWSVAKPASFGVFARTALLFGGNNDGLDALFLFGANASFDLLAKAAPKIEKKPAEVPCPQTVPAPVPVDSENPDPDSDGLDTKTENELGTDPTSPDTDRDGLPDGIEVKGGTDPRKEDSDGDGISDGTEDSNANGIVDEGETDPELADTDNGGVPDGKEREQGTNPIDASDDDVDGDGVPHGIDKCPDTPEGSEIDEKGCTVLKRRMELKGIEFASGSAEILPASAKTLDLAMHILKDHPDARILIEGHTDNTGSKKVNKQLSLDRANAVKTWLGGHGIDESRLSTKGFGSSKPKASNKTDEGKAQNRRIEFRKLGRTKPKDA